MIYLASPYSHPDPAVRERRFRAACSAAAFLLQAGHAVFSPIAHGHVLAEHGLPTDWSFWQRFDREHDAISRSPIDLIPPFATFNGTYRMVQRERVAGGALLAIRSDDRYLSERLGRFDETSQTVRQDPIVVRTKKSQRLNIPARWRHRTLITSHASRNSRK